MKKIMTTGSCANLPKNEEIRVTHQCELASKDTNQFCDFEVLVVDIAIGAAGAGLLFAALWLTTVVAFT